jgi:hypothetical protein
MAVSSAWLAGPRYAASVLLAGTRLHPTDCLAAVLQSQNRCIPAQDICARLTATWANRNSHRNNPASVPLNVIAGNQTVSAGG